MLNQVYNAGLWILFETCCRYKFAVCNTGEGVNDHPEDSVVAYLFVPETRCIPQHLMVQSAFHLISKQCGLRHRWYRMQGLACFQRRSALHLGFWRAFLLKRFWTSCGFILCSRRWAAVFWAWPTCRDLLDSSRELLYNITAEDLLHEGWPSQASDALWMSATTDSPQWRCSRANRHVSSLNRRACERVSCTPFSTQSPKSRSGCIVPMLLCCSNLPLQRLNWLMRERKQLWHNLSYRHTVTMKAVWRRQRTWLSQQQYIKGRTK